MYRILRALCRVLVILCFGLEVEGQENVPSEGGAIIASNHVSFIDPIVVIIGVKRPIHYMAKEELFRSRLLTAFFRGVHAFPVRRGMADRSAIREALAVVSDGSLLGIFPEGRRSRSAESLPLQRGTAFLACKSGVPIIPVVVVNTDRLRFRRPLRIKIGAPLFCETRNKVSKADIAEANSRISKRFYDLLKQESVGL